MTLPLITIDLSSIRMPTGSAEEMAFHTFRNYLEATCAWASDPYSHPDGLLAGVADAVKARPWHSQPAGTKTLSPRAGQMLRNAWATEVLLNAPRTLGDDLVTFANLWTPVQAYYAVFNGITALSHVVTANPAPRPCPPAQLGRHGRRQPERALRDALDRPRRRRARGLDLSRSRTGTHQREDQQPGRAPRRERAVPPGDGPADDPQGADRGAQGGLEEGTADCRRQAARDLPKSELLRRAAAMRPTTLFDLLYRLRIRSNYQEGDAFLTGPLSASDAADFHNALCTIVGATMLTVEIFLAHHVGATTLEANAKKVPIPRTLRDATVLERTNLW